MYRRVCQASTSLGQRGASNVFLDHDPKRGDHTLAGTLDGAGQDEIGEGVDRTARNWQKIRGCGGRYTDHIEVLLLLLV